MKKIYLLFVVFILCCCNINPEIKDSKKDNSLSLLGSEKLITDFEIKNYVKRFIDSFYKNEFYKSYGLDSLSFFEIEWKEFIPYYKIECEIKSLNNIKDKLVLDDKRFQLIGFHDKKPLIYCNVTYEPKIPKFPYICICADTSRVGEFLSNIQYAKKAASGKNIFALELPGGLYYGYLQGDKLEVIQNIYNKKEFTSKTASGSENGFESSKCKEEVLIDFFNEIVKCREKSK